jgi:hypothetical protein
MKTRMVLGDQEKLYMVKLWHKLFSANHIFKILKKKVQEGRMMQISLNALRLVMKMMRVRRCM